MKGSAHVVLYAALMGTAAAGLLTAASSLLGDYQRANKAAEELRNIFAVLDVPFDAGADANEMLQIREASVRERRVGKIRFYEYDHPEAGRLRAFEFAGPGLWGPVKGLLCLRDDLETVFRVSFYEHEETPGLGGEISTEGFQSRFRGKTIVAPGAEPGVRIVRDGADADNEIDAISGATMTCEKVEAMLRAVSEKILAAREAIRKEAGHGR